MSVNITIMFSSTTLSPNSPPEIHRGISLDDTPFDIDTFDLDVLLDTASSSNTSSSDSEADEDFFLHCFDDIPITTSTTINNDETIEEEPSLFVPMLSMFRTDTPVQLQEHSSVPTTPETNYSKRNQSMSKKKSKTKISPKRIEARLASQRYRDTKLSEYNTLTSTHNRLLTLNQNLRYELIKHGKIIELKPPLLDLTTVRIKATQEQAVIIVEVIFY